MVWPKTRPGPRKRGRLGLKSGPARVGPMEGGAFEVSMAMDGRRQLRNDWLLLLHHECVSRRSTGSLRLVI